MSDPASAFSEQPASPATLTRSHEGTTEPLGSDFRTIAEAMPQLLWTAKGDGEIDYVNRRWVEYTGLGLAAFHDLTGEPGMVHPDESHETQRRWNHAVATGEPYEQEFRLRRASDGSYRWFLGRAVPIAGRSGNVVRWIGTATDIDERKRAADSLRFVVEAGNKMSETLDVETICTILAQVTVGYFADWCFVTLVDRGRFDTVAMLHRNQELLHFVEQYRDRFPPRPGDALSRVVEHNEPYLLKRVRGEHLATAARDDEHLALLRMLRMHSVMIVPLTSSVGAVHGALTIVSAESGRLFNETDLSVATDVAGRAATAIEHARIYEAERRTAERLRLTSHVNALLLESSEPWKAMERVAAIVANEIADACAILRLTDAAIRTELIVARDPNRNAIVAGLRGQRALRLSAERAIAERLRSHETIVFANDSPELMKERIWPYLAREVDALSPRSTAIVPLHSGGTTYGALAAYYSTTPFERNDLALLEEIAARASIAVEHAETLERERKIATTLQQASLPPVIPSAHGLRFDTVYAPAGEGEVGGDWYDAVDLDDGSVVISVGDVTGRGIEAAAIMSKVRHAMGMVPLHETDPTKILDSAGWFLSKRYPNAIVTAFVAVISPDRRTLRFANAGHPFPILWRDGELIELRATGLPLGLRTYAPPERSETIGLRDRDILTLYTDGLIEVQREWAQGERALRDVLRSNVLAASVAPAKLIARACLPAQVHDDVAILAVSVGKALEWTFSTDDARAAVDARAQFVEFLRETDASDDLIDRAELIFGELLGNVVRHAPGPVEISFERRNDRAVLHVIDSGTPFAFAERRLPVDEFSELGRGLFIVGQLASEMRVEHVPNCGNYLSVTL